MSAKLGHIVTEETRRKIGEANKIALKGHKPKNLKWLVENNKTVNIGRKHTDQSKHNMSLGQLKNPLRYWLGKKRGKHTKEWTEKIRASQMGERSHFWKGGITPINTAIRESIEYEEWRTKVFERDNYTCQNCEQIGGYLEADHIKPFSLYPDLRLDVDNGRTLCKLCHKKIGWNFFRENNPKTING